MTDIIERLRAGEPCCADPCRVLEARSGCLCATAADEIERLRAERNEALHQLSRTARFAGWWEGAGPWITQVLAECAHDLGSHIRHEYHVAGWVTGDPMPRRMRRELEPVDEARRVLELLEAKMQESKNG
jgi:hypothetical protein